MEPILKLSHADGSQTCEMLLDSIKQSKLDSNIYRTEVFLKDKVYPLSTVITIDAYWEENIITQQVKIINNELGKITLDRFY